MIFSLSILVINLNEYLNTIYLAVKKKVFFLYTEYIFLLFTYKKNLSYYIELYKQ